MADHIKCEETLKRIRQSYRDYFKAKGIPPEKLWISQDTYDMLHDYLEEKYPGLLTNDSDHLYGMQIIVEENHEELITQKLHSITHIEHSS